MSGRAIVKLLCLMNCQPSGNLFRKTLGTSCPVKSQRPEYRCHCVISMTSQTTLWTKCEDYLRTKYANIPDQLTRYVIAFLPMQPSIGIIQHDGFFYF